MNKYVLSNDSESDLDAIWEYIAENSVVAADKWLAKLQGVFDVLAASPRIGHKYETTRDKDSILVWPVGNYLIFYRYHKEWVEIIGVTQGARDIPAFLSERS